jgi:hypothetical protein
LCDFGDVVFCTGEIYFAKMKNFQKCEIGI